MKKLAYAGVFALATLVVHHERALATWWCYPPDHPCVKIPWPPIPLSIPHVRFYCPDCHHPLAHCKPCPPPSPWYLQWPAASPGAVGGADPQAAAFSHEAPYYWYGR
jgi:hypothetical protein